jgi:hypothetical protein
LADVVEGVEEEVQQRYSRQTCVNTILRYELHVWQTCRSNVPNPKLKGLICVLNYASVGHLNFLYI